MSESSGKGCPDAKERCEFDDDRPAVFISKVLVLCSGRFCGGEKCRGQHCFGRCVS